MIPGRASMDERVTQAYQSAYRYAADAIRRADHEESVAHLRTLPPLDSALHSAAIMGSTSAEAIRASWVLRLCHAAADPDGFGADLQGDAARCRDALALAIQARDLLRAAGASRSYQRARDLVSSIRGAIRYAAGKAGPPG